MKKIISFYRSGFTLVEMLMVIAVIALLAGLLLPTLSKSKEKGREMQSIGNAREIAKAVVMFTLDNRNRLPDLDNSDLDSTTVDSSSGNKTVLDYLGGDERVLTSPADRRTDTSTPSYYFSGTTVRGILGVKGDRMTSITNSSAKAVVFEQQLTTDQEDSENQWYTITRRNGGGVIGFLDGHADMVKTNAASPDVSHEYY